MHIPAACLEVLGRQADTCHAQAGKFDAWTVRHCCSHEQLSWPLPPILGVSQHSFEVYALILAPALFLLVWGGVTKRIGVYIYTGHRQMDRCLNGRKIDR